MIEVKSVAADREDLWALAQFPPEYVGWAVEVGAYDGVQTSNTLALEQLGWKVLVVEPNPEIEKVLRSRRSTVWMGACSDYSGRGEFHINPSGPAGLSSLRPNLRRPEYPAPKEEYWKTIEVEVATLDDLLGRFEFPILDAVSVDTEGTELDVLRGLDLDRWRPKVLIVESWDAFNPVVPWLADHGYEHVERRNVNDLFTRRK